MACSCLLSKMSMFDQYFLCLWHFKFCHDRESMGISGGWCHPYDYVKGIYAAIPWSYSHWNSCKPFTWKAARYDGETGVWLCLIYLFYIYWTSDGSSAGIWYFGNSKQHTSHRKITCYLKTFSHGHTLDIWTSYSNCATIVYHGDVLCIWYYHKPYCFFK